MVYVVYESYCIGFFFCEFWKLLFEIVGFVVDWIMELVDVCEQGESYLCELFIVMKC